MLHETSVSVIIPALNEQKWIGLLLKDLSIQSKKDLEIIVVDGGSTDLTQSIVEEYKNVELLKAHPPVGHQRQVGLKKAKGDHVYFIDADSRISPHFIKHSQKQFIISGAGVAIPQYIPDSKSRIIQIFFACMNTIFRFTKSIAPSGGGMCFMVRKSALLDCGGIDMSTQFDDIATIRKVGKKHALIVLSTSVRVSARRFSAHGTIKTLLEYTLLSIMFAFGWFHIADKYTYHFVSDAGMYNGVDGTN